MALAAAALLTAVSILTACGDDDEQQGGAGATGPAAVETRPAKGECEQVEEPRPKRVRQRSAPDFELDADRTYIATVETSCGDFEIELDSENAPKTGGSFVSLARDGFYDGLSFHRIVTGFVIQGGDPRGDGTGGPGYTVREPPPRDVVYSEGVVAMAKSAVDPPGASGSQFFVVTSDNTSLEPVYALLGQVTRGLDVVHRIEEIPAGPDERPIEPVTIDRIRIRTR